MSTFYKKTPSDNQQTRNKMREFNVGAEEEMPEIQSMQDFYAKSMQEAPSGYELSVAEREELQKLRQETNKSQPRLGDYAKQRIEVLANIGRLTKNVELEGVVFTLRTLKDKEAREATMPIFNCKNDVEAALELRRQSLARSIYQIDGQDIETTLGGKDFNLKLQMIDSMEETIVTKLYNSFNELKQEVRVKFGLETEAKAKEVVEDIKK